jgi:energy-coupling factor transporter transmembrane protein EcfT
MIRVIEELLSKQDPTQPHTLLTRLVVSFCICLVYIVLYGFYGLIAGIVVYLLGVELMGLPTNWMFYPIVIGLLGGCWNSFFGIRDYWKNYGYANS